MTDCNSSRRHFLKLAAISGASAFISGLPINRVTAGIINQRYQGEVTQWQSCWAHCLSSCLLKVVKENGQIKRMETDDQGHDEYGQHQVRACLRGRSLHKRTLSPDRLKFPMKRVGKRGEGKFKRISWEEALTEVHQRLSKVIETYGNDAIFYRIGYGNPPAPYHFVSRFLNCIGGYLSSYGSYSNAQINAAATATYGHPLFMAGSKPTEIRHSDLVVYFGNNPANTRMSGGGDTYHYQVNQRKSQAKTIIIDPQYTDSACGREDQWVPIRPGTDAALVEAIAYVLIQKNMVDESFLKTHCYGYDQEEGDASNNLPPLEKQFSYKAYILGLGSDHTPKTPKWAEAICGIPERDIYQLAITIGSAKRPFIAQGWGPQRQAEGEQTARAIFMLPILLGKLGQPGTNHGGMDFQFLGSAIPNMPEGENKVTAKVSHFNWFEAISRGKSMTSTHDGVRGQNQLKNDIKCLFVYQGNWAINQHSDCNQTAKILADESKLDFIFVMDNFLTSSAKFADIVLPDITWLENSRIVSFSTHLTKAEPVFKPMYECQHPYEVFRQLAKKFGCEQEFTQDRTWDEWQQHLYQKARQKNPNLPTYEMLDKYKTIRMPFDEAQEGYSMKAFKLDPLKNPLNTATGKIEIYSNQLSGFAKNWTLDKDQTITALPKYRACWEGYEDIKTKQQYPLQLIGCKPKRRAHSTYQDVAWLGEVLEDVVLINPIDAANRKIQHQQRVHVFNARGRLELPARITPRVMPGVVVIPEGMWYQPDDQGIDKGGCINTLTRYKPTAIAKANPQNTNLVEIEAIHEYEKSR